LTFHGRLPMMPVSVRRFLANIRRRTPPTGHPCNSNGYEHSALSCILSDKTRPGLWVREERAAQRRVGLSSGGFLR
jgi:hypothetical protein